MSSEEIKNYQHIYQEYQEEKQKLIATKKECSEMQDKKRILEKEKQLEEEHARKIDQEIKKIDQNTLIKYQNKMEKSKNKISKFKKNYSSHDGDFGYDYTKSITITISCVLFAIIGAAFCTTSFYLKPWFFSFSLLEKGFTVVAGLFGGAFLGGITGILPGKVASPLVSILTKKFYSLAIKKEQKKFLKIKSKVKEELPDNQAVQTRKNELEAEKIETLNKIESLNSKIATKEKEIAINRSFINIIQSKIDDLFCEISISEVNILSQGEEVEDVIEEEPITKKIGGIQK